MNLGGGVTNRQFIAGSMGGNQLGGPGRTPRNMSQVVSELGGP